MVALDEPAGLRGSSRCVGILYIWVSGVGCGIGSKVSGPRAARPSRNGVEFLVPLLQNNSFH